MTNNPIVVGDLMTSDPIVMLSSATVEEAERKMRAFDVRHLPVVGEDGRLIGVVSDRDLLPSLGTASGRATKLARIMTVDVLTVQPSTPAREASLLLLEHKIGAVVVVDHEGHLRGVLTESDFLRLAHRMLGGDQLAVDDI